MANTVTQAVITERIHLYNDAVTVAQEYNHIKQTIFNQAIESIDQNFLMH